jgi:F420-non-reducing hydrogenase small subunit
MQKGEGLFGSLYQKGDVIFRQSETGEEMYIIQSGAVKVTNTLDGQETIIAVREKGDFFGEMALFENEPRSATVTAICETRLLPLTRSSLLEKVQHDPQVALHFLKSIIFRIQEAESDVKEVMEGDAVLRAALRKSDKSKGGDSLQTDPDQARPVDVSIVELAEIWSVEEGTIWFNAGEHIFVEGEPGDAMYIVLDGTVEMIRGDGTNQQLLRRVEMGDFFGEWTLITDNPRSASAIAVERTQLMSIPRNQFSERIEAQPELALFIIQGLIARLRQSSKVLANPRASVDIVRKSWQPLIKKQAKVKISIVSLATCAGCSAVLLNDEILAQLLVVADIQYCPMLIDQERIQEADLVLVDGAVRLKEEREKLEEARAKSRFLAAWGSCAAFGGIPAEANRFNLEDLITETYGQTADTFAYYLSGERGVEEKSYQEKGVALLRKAGKLDDFVMVDYYMPGCPPTPDMLLQLVGELTGEESGKAQAVVCGQCDRKPTKASPDTLMAYPNGDEDAGVCLNSLGVYCQGFLTQGGCGAPCTTHGMTCWGCRGPAKIALKKMANGDSFEDVVVQGIARRCRFDEGQARSMIKKLRVQGHGLFQFDAGFSNNQARVR